jgi:hypothetical protein
MSYQFKHVVDPASLNSVGWSFTPKKAVRRKQPEPSFVWSI